MDEDWPQTGTLLSHRYRLAERLATGGMAEIWRADDELLGRAVALKLPTPRAAEMLHQAWTEARTTARLSHPHIAAVYDYGESPRPDGSLAPFVVMELLDGESLAARLAGGPIRWPVAARIGAEVASALAAAHARSVVHRDIKPGNVMLTPTGTKILDFGISAVTGAPDDDDTGATFGTPAYVAPERLDGRPAEPATDVYALGTVLFEMVAGEPPYPVDTWEEYAAARAAGPQELPDELPAAFRDVVERCLRDDPARRPPADEVRDRLTPLAGERPSAPAAAGPFTSGRAPAHTVPIVRPAGRTAGRVAIVVALLAAAGVAVVIGSWSSPDDDPDALPSPPPASSEPAVTQTVTVEPEVPPTAPPEPESRDDAVQNVTAAVEEGRSTGRIRDDVAVDLLNLLQQLDNAPAAEVPGRVDALRQKVRQRIGEGGLDAAQADVLQARLDEVKQT
ncbi:serine/threonine-protein kinase [Actinoplanes sp. NPDC049265]|uniref:serine/threonine-protein kinase n=1 Tax=Actinoplanes sp. NPDC049265 TaxID=3363902 RepID=UPI003716E238